jgi:hypothetical protein
VVATVGAIPTASFLLIGIAHGQNNADRGYRLPRNRSSSGSSVGSTDPGFSEGLRLFVAMQGQTADLRSGGPRYKVFRNTVSAFLSSAFKSSPKGWPFTAYVFMP